MQSLLWPLDKNEGQKQYCNKKHIRVVDTVYSGLKRWWLSVDLRDVLSSWKAYNLMKRSFSHLLTSLTFITNHYNESELGFKTNVLFREVLLTSSSRWKEIFVNSRIKK